MFGYHGCFLRIDVSTGRAEHVPVPESVLREYINSDVQAFHVASTLRQFTEVWQLEGLTVRTPENQH